MNFKDIENILRGFSNKTLDLFRKNKGYLLCIGIFFVCTMCSFLYQIHKSSVVNAVNTAKESVNTVTPKVAIVIDDFGYNGQGSEDMLNLPVPITAAIMPFSSNSKETGELAKSLGQEVIIHMPMESLTGKKEWVGDKGIFLNMSEEEIVRTTNEAFEILPMSVGINNHMGSAIMEDERALSNVMSVVADRGVYFLDSVTTWDSYGKEVANNYDVEFFERDVFLDSTDDVDVVRENMLKAMEVAKQTGSAIAIGHVGVEGGDITVRAIMDSIEIYADNGVEFVFLSDILGVVD